MDLFHSILVPVSCIIRIAAGTDFISFAVIFSVKFDPLSTNCRYFLHKLTLFLYILFEFEKIALVRVYLLLLCTQKEYLFASFNAQILSSSFSFLPHSAAAFTIMPEYIILLIKSNDYSCIVHFFC